MTRRLNVIAGLVLAGSLLVSCGKTEETAQSPVKQPVKAAKQKAAAETVDAAAGISGSVEDARLRNPFQSHLVLMKSAPDSPQKIKGPLECCELSIFKVMASVVGVSDTEGFALVQAPDGKRYVVRRGDAIGARDGKVVKIHSKGIIVREHSRDEDGKIKSTEDIELKILEKKI